MAQARACPAPDAVPGTAELRGLHVLEPSEEPPEEPDQ